MRRDTERLEKDSPFVQRRTEQLFWTNTSVKALAGEKDPIWVITQKVRELVFKAVESGWQGPPFDPFWLAAYHGLPVTPRDDIPDARLVPESSRRAKIEFNPNQPKARVRFSLAHEISHTLFPDFNAKIRNRMRTSEHDEWQLELLCNIGASEILMPPIPSLELGLAEVTLEKLMPLWRRFEVSPEALLLRIVRLTSQPLSVFSAANVNDARDSDFRLDYCIPSGSSDIRPAAGLRIRKESILSECTAIGFTAKGRENWQGGREWDVECIGIPPYPGKVYPRIIGILRSKGEAFIGNAGIQFVYGDITEPRGQGRKIIAHIVNDKTPNWGAGVARAIATQWPDVREDFRNFATIEPHNFRLGKIRETRISEELSVVSMVAQHGYGYSSKPRIRYGALERCLMDLRTLAKDFQSSIHMPRIGTGFAGGNWAVIEELIRENLVSHGIGVVVYQLPGSQAVSGQTFLDTFALLRENCL